ncbi:transcriptional regulator [Campylobacter sp. faydin G-140]|uniref:transcriptional regulator n=1 Tax=Campylobacter anatolicus TaxID=2829105 RepID=UPI001B93D662|nr:transcriptional regulator [Campylobacter anatolicus]MBR8466208.1 transcriptional regulator [Campylobacter anatolicus]
MSDENIIKKTCKELGLTYKQLGELIGYSEGAIKSAINSGNISEPMKRVIELYLKNLELQNQLKEFENFKSFIKSIK